MEFQRISTTMHHTMGQLQEHGASRYNNVLNYPGKWAHTDATHDHMHQCDQEDQTRKQIWNSRQPFHNTITTEITIIVAVKKLNREPKEAQGSCSRRRSRSSRMQKLTKNLTQKKFMELTDDKVSSDESWNEVW